MKHLVEGEISVCAVEGQWEGCGGEGAALPIGAPPWSRARPFHFRERLNSSVQLGWQFELEVQRDLGLVTGRTAREEHTALFQRVSKG